MDEKLFEMVMAEVLDDRDRTRDIVRYMARVILAEDRFLNAAVRDLKEYGVRFGFTCEVCAHMRGTNGNLCYYPEDVGVSGEMCRVCDKCPCGRCNGESEWRWRGPQKEGACDG